MQCLQFCGSACRCFILRAVWQGCTVVSSSVLKPLQFSGNRCGGVLLGRRAAKGGQFVTCLVSEERLDGERWFKWLLDRQLCLELRFVSLCITQGWCRPGMTATLEIAEVMFCIVRLHFNFSYQTAHGECFDKVMTEKCWATSLFLIWNKLLLIECVKINYLPFSRRGGWRGVSIQNTSLQKKTWPEMNSSEFKRWRD